MGRPCSLCAWTNGWYWANELGSNRNSKGIIGANGVCSKISLIRGGLDILSIRGVLWFNIKWKTYFCKTFLMEGTRSRPLHFMDSLCNFLAANGYSAKVIINNIILHYIVSIYFMYNQAIFNFWDVHSLYSYV